MLFAIYGQLYFDVTPKLMDEVDVLNKFVNISACTIFDHDNLTSLPHIELTHQDGTVWRS